jgi:hypothetical protein
MDLVAVCLGLFDVFFGCGAIPVHVAYLMLIVTGYQTGKPPGNRKGPFLFILAPYY